MKYNPQDECQRHDTKNFDRFIDWVLVMALVAIFIACFFKTFF